MLPTWREAFLQCLDLLSDHSRIAVTRHLLDEAQLGDTPDADFALAAGMAACKQEQTSLTKEVITHLTDESAWGSAISLNLREALNQLAKVAAGGKSPDLPTFQHTLSTHPDILNERDTIHHLSHLDCQYSIIDKMLQLLATGSPHACRSLAIEVCRTGKPAIFQTPLRAETWKILLRQFELLIEPIALSGRLPSLGAVDFTLQSANGHNREWPQEPSQPALRCEFKFSSGNHDFHLSDYHYCQIWPGLAAEIAWHLKIDGYPDEAFLAEHRVPWKEYCSCGRVTTFPPTYESSVSLELAQAIIQNMADQREQSENLAEAGEWSLLILRDHPAVSTISTLFRLHYSRAPLLPLDAALVQEVVNNQPWHEAARLSFPDSTAGRFWHGFCLLMAALPSRILLHPSTLANDATSNMLLKGITLTTSDTNKLHLRALRHIMDFTSVSLENIKDIASKVIFLCKEHRTRTAFIVLKALSRRIQELGLFPDYPELRDPAWTEFRRAEARVRS